MSSTSGYAALEIRGLYVNVSPFFPPASRPHLPEGYEDWCNSFDLVVAADCFFTFHTSTYGGLLRCIDYLLSTCSGSTFFALAPRRGTTLGEFTDLASSFEVCERFHWKVRLLQPSAVFPGLVGDSEKTIPHLVCIQRR